MKKLLLLSLIAFSSYTQAAKEVLVYNCQYEKDINVELSLLDKNAPNIGLYYQNSKFALCHLENTPLSRMSDPRAQIQESQWILKLKKCDYYIEKHKDLIPVSSEITFKQSGPRRGNTLALSTNHQPISCFPKK